MESYLSAKDALLEQSIANMAGLLNTADDCSLEKEAVVHHLSEHKTSSELRKNAYKWCRRCLRGSWAKIEESQFRIEHVRYIVFSIGPPILHRSNSPLVDTISFLVGVLGIFRVCTLNTKCI